MSQRNGDKSRFNRERKQRIHRRIRNRELVRASGTSSIAKAAEGKSEGISTAPKK
jgi:hypothetical protein